MSDIPSTEPTEFIAGDTIQWSKSLADYPADTYELKYNLQPIAGGTLIEITAAANGTDFATTISAATSAGYSATDYRWFSAVTDLATGLIRHSIDQGDLTIHPDPATLTSTDDLRSGAKIIVDTLDAYFQGGATIAQKKLVLGDKTIEKHDLSDLLTFYNQFYNQVKNEEAAEAIRKGLGTGDRILPRFV